LHGYQEKGDAILLRGRTAGGIEVGAEKVSNLKIKI